MLTRTKRVTLGIAQRIDRRLAAGEYNEVATDEELIEGLSLLLYRRIATLIFLPADAGQQPSLEMVNFDPAEAAHQPGSGGVNVVPIGWSRLKPKAL